MNQYDERSRLLDSQPDEVREQRQEINGCGEGNVSLRLDPDAGWSRASRETADSAGHIDELSAFGALGRQQRSDSLEEWAGRSSPHALGRQRHRMESDGFLLRSANKSKNARPLGTLAICFITYFNVCGGPWGSEEIVSSAGPLYGFVGIFVFVAFWAIPMVLITSEMSSCYPDDGGYSIWVAEAFGPFWGFQEAWWSWASGVVDTASYPVLALDTVSRIVNITHHDEFSGDSEPGSGGFRDYAAKLALVALFTLPNFCATGLFGRWMTFLTGFVFLPFLVHILWLFIFRMDEMDFSRLLETKSDPSLSDWAQLISVLYWNFSGFDASSTCAGEVRNPGKTYPRGLSAALILISLTYILPLSVFTTINEPKWETWEEGSFSKIAQVQVGQWMAIWIVISSFASNTGQYTAEVFEDSWNLCGMARTGLMPEIFGSRWNGDTGPPYMALAAALFVIAILVRFDFSEIVYITNLFNCLSCLLELCSFLKLRMVEPDLERPYKVPVQQTTMLCVFLLFPFSLAIFILSSSLFASVYSNIISLVVLFLGLFLYYFQRSKGKIQYQRQQANVIGAF